MRHLKDVVLQVEHNLRHEKDSEAHRIFRASQPRASSDKTDKEPAPGIYAPGATGVIYCSDRATQNGWKGNDDPEWANFGQGAPEVGAIPGGSRRLQSIPIDNEDYLEYAPTSGIKELREAVANYYNQQYRQGQASQYTYKNVCIVPGGRAGLTRVAAIIGDCLVAYQLPEYTAYENVLSIFKRLVPIPSTLDERNNYDMDLDELKRSIKSQGISAVVMSLPRNPLGLTLAPEKLKKLVELSKERTTLCIDEFYSWYSLEREEEGISHSVAEYVDNVKNDPVIIIDGLTKNWRYPGLRCCWVVGPEKVISALSQSGSFLDGGTAHPVQRAVIPLLEYERVKQDRIALQRHFRMKRDHVLMRLDKMGIHVTHPPTHTFYLWLDLSKLPSPLNSGLVFFEECLKEKVIVVPGIFFDINPSHRRSLLDSPCHHFVRFSFGPPLEVLDRGLNNLERVVQKARLAIREDGHLHDKMGHSFVVTDTKSAEHPGAGS